MITHQHPHRHMSRFFIITAGLVFFLSMLPPRIRAALFYGLINDPYLSGMIILFGALSLSLLWAAGQKIDALIFSFFNFKGKRPLWLDKAMLTFTQLGNGIAGITVAVILFFIDDHRLAYEIVLGTLILWIVVEIMKALFRRSRPFIRLTQTRIVGPRERGRSFPSGHTSQIFFMVTLVSQHFHLLFYTAVFLYIIAVLVAVTRMYVGAHYPRDVVAGSILGSVLGSLGAIVDAHYFSAR